MNADDEVMAAVAKVPPGRWGVAVSGGADSVALLLAATLRPQLQLQVIHLDHETRDGGSGRDAAFVETLAARLRIPFRHARRSQIESALPPSPGTPGEGRGEGSLVVSSRIYDGNAPHPNPLPGYRERGPEKNTSARFRAARLAWFSQVVKECDLAGVLTAHHADDQAETVAQRLLRGRQPHGLRGMKIESSVDGVRLFRPLLAVPRQSLRDFLNSRNQNWAEDPSNASPDYQRSRVRVLLNDNDELRNALLSLGDASARLADWLSATAPVLGESFEFSALASQPLPLARHAAGRWLCDRGCPADDMSPLVCDRLIVFATDLSGPARLEFPGRISVRRLRGHISILPSNAKGLQQFGSMGVLEVVHAGHHPAKME